MLLRDEREEEKLQHRKTELVLKRSTVEDKLALAAQMSLNTGHWFERIQEFPDRSETFSDRLLYPLPLNSSDIWVLRSKLDDSSEHLQPRRNFNLINLFSKIKFRKMSHFHMFIMPFNLEFIII